MKQLRNSKTDPLPLAVVQARVSSSRLPGKVLADLDGEPVLALLIKRLQRAKSLGRIVIATTTHPGDDLIAELCEAMYLSVVRGPNEDVLGRFLIAIHGHYGPVVRITGDCPLVDPGLVDSMVEIYTRRGVDYVTNAYPTRTFPDGLDLEVVDAEVLREIADDDLTDADREHVTLAVRNQPERFSHVSAVNATNEGHLRWTIDTEADLRFMRGLVRSLGERRYRAGHDAIWDEHKGLLTPPRAPEDLTTPR